MEEKKLTDEEIIKDIERSTGMPSYWKKIVIDVIHHQKAEIERLTEENRQLKEYRIGLECENSWLSKECNKATTECAELQKQVDELKKERENIQKILYELGKCGNDKERYAVWVKLIKYCGVEVE